MPPYSSSQSPTYSSTQYYQKPHRPYSPPHASSSLLPDGYQNRDENINGNDNGNRVSGTNSQQSNNVGYAGTWGYVNSNDKHVPNRDKDRDYNMNSNIPGISNNNKNQNVDRDRNNEDR